MDFLVVLAFILVSFLQFSFPLVFGYWLVKRFRAPKKVFAYGMLFFALVQVLHTPLVLAVQQPLLQYLKATIQDNVAVIAVFAVVVGLLAGLFEEVGRFLVFRHFFRRKEIGLKKENALMFGAGWGGIESMLIGIVLFVTMFSYIYAAPLAGKDIADMNAGIGGTMTAGQAEFVKNQNEALINLTPPDLFPSLLERVMTFILHIAFTLMVLSAVVSGRKFLLVLAILWHSAVDASAVFLGQTAGIFAAEAAVFVFAVVALFYIRKQWPK